MADGGETGQRAARHTALAGVPCGCLPGRCVSAQIDLRVSVQTPRKTLDAIVPQSCDYAKNWTVVDAMDEAAGEPLFTGEERAWVMGRTAASVFKIPEKKL